MRVYRVLNRLGVDMLLFRVVHPRTSVKERPAEAAAKMPGWFCSWRGDAFRFDMVCVHPPVPFDLDELLDAIVKSFDTMIGDTFVTGVFSVPVSVSIITGVKTFSADHGRPVPHELSIAVYNDENGVTIKLGADSKVIVNGVEHPLPLAFDDIVCISDKECLWRTLRELDSVAATPSEKREAAKLAMVLHNLVNNVLKLATDVDTYSFRVLANRARKDPVETAVSLVEVIDELSRIGLRPEDVIKTLDEATSVAERAARLLTSTSRRISEALGHTLLTYE